MKEIKENIMQRPLIIFYEQEKFEELKKTIANDVKIANI
jgi:hypothetical protein